MRIRTAGTALLTAIIFSLSTTASASVDRKAFREAVNLYEHGLYERAMTLFESQPGDPLCSGYAVLCAVRMKAVDSKEKVEEYDQTYPGSIMGSEIHRQYGLNIFDEGDYEAAREQFLMVREKSLSPKEQSELNFKKGYCSFVAGNIHDASDGFYKVDGLPHSDYTAPARYHLGYLDYVAKRFGSAQEWFKDSAKDPRFQEISEFYIVDCRFNEKDYDYVLEKGLEMYEGVPAERQSRLSRMISESYLVKGDAENARLYLEKEQMNRSEMTRSDYFHAGTVLYTVGDYKGAVENYEQITDRTDSLGQIANYHLGNAYVKTKNKVAALDAFKDAASLSFDPEMQEDAYFNYAKLAFDINQDSAPFKSYLQKYSTSRKGDKIYSYIALACLYNHDYAGAVEAYDQIDDLDPEQKSNYMKAYYLRAEQLISSGSYRDAVPCLKAASYYVSRRDPFNQLARYWLAESYYRSEQFQESASVFSDLHNISALDGKKEGKVLTYNLGYCYFSQQNYEAAAKWFDTYTASGDKSFREDAMIRRADCDYASKDYKAAIASYQKVLDEFFSPDDIYPYYQQALSYGLTNNKKQKVEALAPVMNASKISPYYPEAMYELGRAYMDVKDPANAALAFNTLRYNTSDDTFVARALIGLGMVSRNQSEHEAALGYYKQVVSLMPGSEYADDALLAIESIYQTMKQPQKYLEYVEQNKLDADKSPEDRELMYFNTAEQVFLSENYSQAISSLEKYIASYPKGLKVSESYFYLAESYRLTGQKEKACEYYTKSLETNSAGSFAEFALSSYSDLSQSLERYSDAYEGYSRLASMAQLETNVMNARKGMMRAAYKGKDYEKAVSAADVVIAEQTSGEDLRREAQLIKAKSLLATSRRKDALDVFEALSARPYTAEGAEATVMLIQNTFDKGDFDGVEAKVYDFAQKAGSQSYWLAKSFLILGDAFAERGNDAQAKATYESVRDGYSSSDPSDDIADNVKLRLERFESPESK